MSPRTSTPHRRTPKDMKRIFFLFFMGLTLSLLIAWPQTVWAKPARVVVSLKPIHSLVTQLMAGVATPQLIVRGNVTPHGYRLSQDQTRELEKADLVIWIGPELEPFLSAPIRRLPKRVQVMELLANPVLKILDARHDPTKRDPHLWMDVRNGEVLVDELFKALVAVDPDHAADYLRNRRRLKIKVARLERGFEYGFRAVAAGEGWVYHDTQQYFEQAYAFRVRGIFAPKPGAPADTARLLQARAAIMAEGGKACVFTEAGLTTDKLSLLTMGLPVTVVELDSYATRFSPGPDLYFAMLTHNFEAIAGCFRRLAKARQAAEKSSGKK